MLEQLYQFDFRSRMTPQILKAYLQNQELHRKYWYEALKDKVDEMTTQ